MAAISRRLKVEGYRRRKEIRFVRNRKEWVKGVEGKDQRGFSWE